MTEDFDMLFDYDESLKRLNRSQSEVDSLRNSLREIDKVPKSITDKLLLCFLNACNDENDAVKVIKMYYKTKRSAPQLFNFRDPESPAIQKCFKNMECFYLPVTPDGSSVVYIGLENDNSSNYDFDNANKTFFMTLDACISAHGPQTGLILLFDMNHLGFGHITKIKLKTQKAFINYAQEALPANLKSIHIFNVSAIFQMIMAVLRPMISADVIGKIHLHSSSMDYEDFYKNVIPKEFMPSDYGGDLESVEQLNKKNSELLVNLKSYFTAEQEQVFLDEQK